MRDRGRTLAILVGLALVAGLGPVAGPPPAVAFAATELQLASEAYADSWALVIGINTYEKAPRLNYAAADARAVAEQLTALGFPRKNVRLLLDREATRAGIERVLYRDFARMGRNDRLFVYFAGHGDTVAVKDGEEGFILSVDADPDSLSATAISMDDLRRIGRRVLAKHVLFVMDACFSGFALTRDIVPQPTPEALLAASLRESVVQVLTAGRKGERSIEEGGHGLFTRRLLDGMRGLADPRGRGFITAADLAAWVGPRVIRDSSGKMTPQYAKLDGEGEFVFLVPRAQVAALPVAPDPPRPAALDTIRKEIGSLALNARVDGVEVFVDGRRVGELGGSRPLVLENLVAGTYRVKAQKPGHKGWEREIRVAAEQRTDLLIDIEPLGPARRIGSEDGAEMVLVPAGEFWMGTTKDDAFELVQACTRAGRDELTCRAALEREQPKHRVIADAFYIDQHEVTNAQFGRFVAATDHRTTAEREGRGWVNRNSEGWVEARGASWRTPDGPGTERAPNAPVAQVSWFDAQAYCKWAGKRLPTEAEWEKAARGTDGRRYPWGNEWDASRVKERSAKGPTGVGSRAAGVSPYGAHDMAGNVWEWVADWFDKDYYRRGPESNPTGPPRGQFKVLRGGSWADTPVTVRAAYREVATPETRNTYVGFRCAKDGPR